MAQADVIDTLVGIRPGSMLDTVRAGRPEARSQAQASYLALFEPAELGGIGAVERFALGAFVTGLHGESPTVDFYAEKLNQSDPSKTLSAAVQAAIKEATTTGPYGSFPAGPLSREDQPGPVYTASAEVRAALGPRLAAAFEHLHMLVFHPRDAAPAHLQALLDAGWTTTDIVTLSQICSFLSFQIRVVAGLTVLAARSEAPR